MDQLELTALNQFARNRVMRLYIGEVYVFASIAEDMRNVDDAG